MTSHDAERSVFEQNLHLIWLDSHLDESDKHFRSNLDRLRSMVKKIDTFTNTQKCIDFVTKTTDDGISMIVSECSGEKIISLFDDLQQIETIYVFGTDTFSNTKWIDNYSKIKGVFMDIDSLCGALQRAKRQSNDDSIQISLVSTSGESDIVRLDQLEPSKEKRVSMNFARCALGNPDFVGILYTMNIDPAVSSTPFASLTNVSYYADTEQEILFAMNTVFRIDEIKAIDKDDRLWEVHLTLTADNDPRLRDLLARLRQDTQGASGWHRLGRLLIRLGQSKQAENVYQFLLEQTSDEPIKGYFYHQLGCLEERVCYL
ncbi:hypothetical protein I4U23_003924 [Adineta vaga]|nr:hypothetical protein I4U23_003924 [Adineta vaga]